MQAQSDMLTSALAEAPEGHVLVPANRRDPFAVSPLTPHVLEVRRPERPYKDRWVEGIQLGELVGWQLHLPYEVDPIPMNGRRAWQATSRAVRSVRETASWLATQIPRQERIRVELVQHVTSRHDRDPDNLSHTYKALVDGLRDDAKLRQTGIVANDTPAYVDRLMARIEYHAPDGRRRDLLLKGWMRLHIWPAVL